MPKTWTLEKAKNSFSAVVAGAERGQPQLVTKRGKPAVYVLSASDYATLKGDDPGLPQKNFIEHLLSIPKRPPSIPDDEELFPRADWVLRDIDLGD